MEKAVLGKAGEDFAVTYLRRKGLTILERNYRAARGEMDIIARHKGVIVFVEVKTRSGNAFGRPAEAVTARKRHTYTQLALTYLQQKGWLEHDARFDVLEIWKNGVSWNVNHIENAFDAQ